MIYGTLTLVEVEGPNLESGWQSKRESRPGSRNH